MNEVLGPQHCLFQPLLCLFLSQPHRSCSRAIPHMLTAAFGYRLVGTPIRTSGAPSPAPRLSAAFSSPVLCPVIRAFPLPHAPVPAFPTRQDRCALRRLQPSSWLGQMPPQERAGWLSGSPCARPFSWGLRSCIVCCVLLETFASHVLGSFMYFLIYKRSASLTSVSIVPGAGSLPL